MKLNQDKLPGTENPLWFPLANPILTSGYKIGFWLPLNGRINLELYGSVGVEFEIRPQQG